MSANGSLAYYAGINIAVAFGPTLAAVDEIVFGQNDFALAVRANGWDGKFNRIDKIASCVLAPSCCDKIGSPKLIHVTGGGL